MASRSSQESGAQKIIVSLADIQNMKKEEFRRYAKDIGIRTHVRSFSETADRTKSGGRQIVWRSMTELVDDCTRHALQYTQGHIPQYFAMKRPASTSSSVRKVGSMKKEDLLSELANVKDITAFRKKAKALHLTVRQDSGRESGRQSWRSRSDILSDYARLLEQDG